MATKTKTTLDDLIQRELVRAGASDPKPRLDNLEKRRRSGAKPIGPYNFESTRYERYKFEYWLKQPGEQPGYWKYSTMQSPKTAHEHMMKLQKGLQRVDPGATLVLMERVGAKDTGYSWQPVDYVPEPEQPKPEKPSKTKKKVKPKYSVFHWKAPEKMIWPRYMKDGILGWHAHYHEGSLTLTWFKHPSYPNQTWYCGFIDGELLVEDGKKVVSKSAIKIKTRLVEQLKVRAITKAPAKPLAGPDNQNAV